MKISFREFFVFKGGAVGGLLFEKYAFKVRGGDTKGAERKQERDNHSKEHERSRNSVL